MQRKMKQNFSPALKQHESHSLSLHFQSWVSYQAQSSLLYHLSLSRNTKSK